MRTLLLVLAALAASSAAAREDPPAGSAPGFVLPCEAYAKGLRRGGNFGVHVDAKSSPFHDSWHLAEDVWLPAGTPVRAVADGVVRYSAFSPTWTDAQGATHWNLGNVIVVEHPLAPAVDGMDAVCSFYVHLAADRRVQVGERVVRGQVLGRIGADRSEENGRYPAHLHINLGPAFRSRGIGARLIEAFAAVARARGAPGMHVVTGEGMRNVRFYQRCGFVEAGRTTWNGRPIIFLARSL